MSLTARASALFAASSAFVAAVTGFLPGPVVPFGETGFTGAGAPFGGGTT
ncbi:hypothetical protein [Streptomyces goshikiensis]